MYNRKHLNTDSTNAWGDFATYEITKNDGSTFKVDPGQEDYKKLGLSHCNTKLLGLSDDKKTAKIQEYYSLGD